MGADGYGQGPLTTPVDRGATGAGQVGVVAEVSGGKAAETAVADAGIADAAGDREPAPTTTGTGEHAGETHLAELEGKGAGAEFEVDGIPTKAQLIGRHRAAIGEHNGLAGHALQEDIPREAQAGADAGGDMAP